MAQFGKLSGTVTDNQGNPLSGATVEVRRQGAFVTSTQAGPSYTVNDPGGIVATDQVKVNALSTPTRNVSSVTLTTVVTGGPGLGTLNNNDRITPYNPLPTLYADASGSETKANPLTTDASGFWYCWVEIRPYDILETYASTVRLKTDLVPEGQEHVQSNLVGGAGTVAYRRTTTRTMTAGRLATWENPVSTIKTEIDYAGNVITAGNLTAVNATFSGTESVTGNATIGGTLGVTGLTTLTGGASVAAPFTYTGAAGSFTLTAGSIETADLAANAVVATRIGTGTTDQTLTAAAAYADLTSVTVTFTPFSTASEIVLIANVPMESTAASAFFGFIRIVDGTAATIYHESGALGPAATGQPVTIECVARLTGLSGSQTFKVQAKCVTTNAIVNSSSTDRKAKIIAMEFKK